MDISILIPAYNEAKSIGSVLDTLTTLKKDNWEIIVIDDGSEDDTANIVASYEKITLIKHEKNKGYGAALKTGIRQAKGDIILTLDSDGQHDPHQIEELLKHAPNYAMVSTCRTQRIHSNLWRMPGKWFLGKLANYLSKSKIPDLNSGFRAFKKEIVTKYLHLCPNGFSISTTLTLTLLCEGYDIKFIPTKVNKRVGKSMVSIKTGFDTILLILRLITLFNPLRVFIPISLVIGGLGGILLIENILKRDLNDATVLLLLASILIFLFGLMADQMAHIRREMK